MSVHIGESEDCSSFDGGEGERYLPCCTSGLNTARLTIVVGDKHFSEERLLLVQSCDYFQALCRSGMKECQQEEIHLRSLHAQGFIITLAVLHGEMPILDGDDIVEAIECGAFLQVTSLTKHLINLCDADNCLLMYHPAATLGLIDLYHTAALFIRDMYADLEEEVRKTLPLELITYVESLTPSVFVAVGAHVTCCVDETVHAASRTISYLDETGNTWKVLIDLPLEASTSMAGVTVLDNKLYIIGGVHGVYKQIVDSCFCYSVESSSWSSIPSPAQLHYNLNLVGADGYLYAIGGEYEQTVMSSVETYNVKLRSWTFAAHLPRLAAGAACTKTMSSIFRSLFDSSLQRFTNHTSRNPLQLHHGTHRKEHPHEKFSFHEHLHWENLHREEAPRAPSLRAPSSDSSTPPSPALPRQHFPLLGFQHGQTSTCTPLDWHSCICFLLL
ncbi:kelch repeat and BTB domain-containing protein 13-like, partial [Stegastes partitus]|uniref:Kelch repeat and BTB domain-containing protein 13-like n=1 Tax=Stegastes partitus TaxID=144197 RepID=A0A9Y4N3A0_9TELE